MDSKIKYNVLSTYMGYSYKIKDKVINKLGVGVARNLCVLKRLAHNLFKSRLDPTILNPLQV